MLPKREFIFIILFALLTIEIESGKRNGEDESGQTGHRKKGKISRRNKEEDMKKAKEIVDGLKKMKNAEGFIGGGDIPSNSGPPMFANLHYESASNVGVPGTMMSHNRNIATNIHDDDIHRVAMFNSFLKHNQNHQPQLPPFHQYPSTNPYSPHSNPSIPFAPPSFMPPIHQQISNFQQQQQVHQIGGPNLHNAELHGQQIDNSPQFLANLDGMRATNRKSQNQRELGIKEKNVVLEVGVVGENRNQGAKGKGKILAMTKGKGKQPDAVYEGHEYNENESEELSPNEQEENHDEHQEKNIIKMKIKVNTSQCPKINVLYRREKFVFTGRAANKELPIGLAKLRKSATEGSSLDEWKWSEFDEFTWTNGMVAAFSLPTVWAEEMMKVDDFQLEEQAQSGQKENEFIEGNIFRLKIFKNPDLKLNKFPDIISDQFTFDNTEEIIQFNVECIEEMQQNGEFKEVIKGNITKTTLLQMNAHLLTGQRLIDLPYKQLMPVPASMAMQKEIHPNELLTMPPPSKGAIIEQNVGHHQEWPKMGEGSSSGGVGKTPEEIMEEDFERNKGNINEALWENDGPFGEGEMGDHHHHHN